MTEALPLASLTMPTSKPDVHFLDSRPGKPADLEAVVRTAYSRGESAMCAKFAFAYATSSGLQALLPAFSRYGTWEETEKKWVVGVHHGITEPRALKELLSLSNSRTRVFVNGKQLTKESLASSKKLHAKVFCIESGSEKNLSALVAGSANLTGAALGRTSQNYEVGLAYLPDKATSIASSLNAWWSEVWKNSINVTERLIDDYSLLRQQFIARNPDVVHDLEAPSELDAAHAKSLWMEAGAMSGGSRNQIEFGRELAAFFGPVENHQRLLVMRNGGMVWNDRPLSPKRTTFGVPIWRLSLPTSYQGAPSYPGKIVKFTRSRGGGSEVFRIDVVDAHSPRHLRWLRESHRDGHFSATSGGRQFGLA
jgi:HKD family nuclease